MTRTARYTFIDRPEGKNFDLGNHRYLDLTLPVTDDVDELLALARAGTTEGTLGKGSHRSACFQIQTDDGIWFGKNDKRITGDTATFKTWAQMEAEELAAA